MLRTRRPLDKMKGRNAEFSGLHASQRLEADRRIVQGESSARSNAGNTWAVKLLHPLQMDIPYEYCLGAELFHHAGTPRPRFSLHYCIHNTGHNDTELAGELAKHLCKLAGGGLGQDFPRTTFTGAS